MRYVPAISSTGMLHPHKNSTRLQGSTSERSTTSTAEEETGAFRTGASKAEFHSWTLKSLRLTGLYQQSGEDPNTRALRSGG